MQIKNILIATALASLSAGAFAQVPFGHMREHGVGHVEGIADHHEGRAEIEHRLQRQGERIFRKVRAGVFTTVQGAALRGEDNRVREEMRDMEARHEGMLTRDDRIILNRQLDEVSRRIGR
jgi:hypothetical protein